MTLPASAPSNRWCSNCGAPLQIAANSCYACAATVGRKEQLYREEQKQTVLRTAEEKRRLVLKWLGVFSLFFLAIIVLVVKTVSTPSTTESLGLRQPQTDAVPDVGNNNDQVSEHDEPVVNSGASIDSDSQNEKQLWAKSILNQKAPELIVEKWLSKKPSTEGKFVLIDFWATWCGPCREAIPELNEFQKKYKDKLVVIGISDESQDTVSRFRSPKIQYFSAIDTQGRTKKELEVSAVPHVIILDPNRVVRWEGFPFLDGYELTPDVLEKVFTKYGETKPSPH